MKKRRRSITSTIPNPVLTNTAASGDNLVPQARSQSMIGIAIVLLAAAVRLWWIFAMQHPADFIVSDMAGYIGRAQHLIDGTQTPDRYLAVYPFGGHYFYAFEMLLFGKENFNALAIMQALLGAASVGFIWLAAKRCLQSPWVVNAIGVIMALWYPHIIFVGYFSSEVPYTFFMTLSLWLSLRLLQTGKGAFVTGLVSIVAFTIRPQILLTVLLGLAWAALRRRESPGLTRRHLILFIVPIVAGLIFSAWRAHDLTGNWRLISENDQIGRLFASSDYLSIESIEMHEDGSGKRRRFQPPATQQIGATEPFRFYGYIADPQILKEERERITRDLSLAQRVGLIQRNISLLAWRNAIWPEMQVGKTEFRKVMLQQFDYIVRWLLIPAALFGCFWLGRYSNPGVEIVLLHLITMIYAAAVYFGETRYRVPYDGFLMLIAAFPFGARSVSVGGNVVSQSVYVKYLLWLLLVGFGGCLLAPWPPLHA